MIGFRYVLALATSSQILASAPVTTPHPRLQLVNGATIEFRSRHTPGNLMGFPIAGAVNDEAGQMSPEQHAAISTRRSATLGPILNIGNPGVSAGPFRELCQKGEEARAAGSHLSKLYSLHRWTWRDRYDALAAFDPAGAEAYREFIESERETLWDIEFRRLYEAEWTEDEAAVFRGVDDLTAGEPITAANPADKYSIGVDVGQQVDYLVAIGIGKVSHRADFMLRFRGIPYPQAAVRLIELQQKFPGVLWIETNGPGLGLYQELKLKRARVEPFDTTKKSKEEILQSLAGALNVETRRLTLAKMDPLQYELKSFRYIKKNTGAVTSYYYGAPDGKHDDCVMALALAWHGASIILPGQGAVDYLKREADKIRARQAGGAPSGTQAMWRRAA